MAVGEVKESKAQRAERLKRELNPWEAYETIVRFAREGLTRSRPSGDVSSAGGVSTRRATASAPSAVSAGGQGDPPLHDPYPHPERHPRLPAAAHDRGSDRALRAGHRRHHRAPNVQLHWVTIEDLPAVMQELWRAGLTSLGACGDCDAQRDRLPLAGVDGDAIIDASPLVLAATRC